MEKKNNHDKSRLKKFEPANPALQRLLETEEDDKHMYTSR